MNREMILFIIIFIEAHISLIINIIEINCKDMYEKKI